MGTIPSPTFQGQSKFASDFQQVLTRAVNIAALPLQMLQNDLSTMNSQRSALSGLSGTFSSLQTALQNIGSASGSVSANSSNPAAVQANVSSNARPGLFTVQVTALGSSSTTISSAGSPPVTDPASGNISSASSFDLVINSVHHTIAPSGSALDDLASAINSAALGVQATVVNVGTNASPDYRLSVTSNNLAPDTIQLNGGANLLTTLSTGAPTSFTVNGVSTTSNSSQVTLSPGLTVNLLQQTASPVTITLAQDSNSLSNSLSSFANAYNSAVDAVGRQHGLNAGVLNGQSTVLSLAQVLSSINQYTGGPSGTTTLADIGLNLDATGHLSFDGSTLNSQSAATVQQFLGSATTGGFLQAANNALNSLTDPTSGVFQISLGVVQGQIVNESSLISRQQDQITLLQTNLQKQLSAADATLSVLESQVTFMTNLMTTQNASAFSGR